MAVSKNGKLYFTEEEKELAKNNNNALQYALTRGYKIIREGTYSRLEVNKKIVFHPNGSYYDNTGVGKLHGDAIDFAMNIEGMTYTEAILAVAGSTSFITPQLIKEVTSQNKPKPERVKLPPAAPDNKVITDYLCSKRGIDKDVVAALINRKMIYQSAKYNSLVMVGYDENSKPKYAAWRSTTDHKRGDCAGSDKSYPFFIKGKTDSVVVCESPIEVMSYFCISRKLNSENTRHTILSLGGALAVSPLERFLKDNPNITTIICGLNNDKTSKVNTGAKGYERIYEKYSEKYTVQNHLPYLNDWNDVLKDMKGIVEIKEKAVQEKSEKNIKKGELER